ncbi:hypothetical protein LINPERPRIM_LOCUS7975 [Linum perenne]
MNTTQSIRLLFLMVLFIVAGKQLVTVDAKSSEHICRRSFSTEGGDCVAASCQTECSRRFGPRVVGKCDTRALYQCNCYSPCL